MEIATGDAGLEMPAGALGCDSVSGQRIIIYGMNYGPEIAGVGKYTGEIAELLAGRAADVSVVTTPPHYPGWQVQAGFRNFYSSRSEGNVSVVRVPLLLRKKMGGIWRLIAPLSFAVTSAPVIFWQILRQRPHLVICVEPTLFAAPIAILAAKIVGARTVLHVQDLEVDAAFAVGHIRSGKIIKKLAFLFEKFALKRFDRIITISNRMAQKLVEKDVAKERVSIVRNWVDLDHIHPLGRPSAYRQSLGYRSDDFIVLYAGNIGAKQGLDTLMQAASHLKDKHRIQFVIAGEGPAKADLQARYGRLANVRFLPFQPYDQLNEFLNLADLHALPQDRGAADLVLPSKLGGMLASGSQIIVTADQGTELDVFLNGSALITPPGDSAALAQGIGRAMDGDREAARLKRAELAKLLSKRDGVISFISAIMR